MESIPELTRLQLHLDQLEVNPQVDAQRRVREALRDPVAVKPLREKTHPLCRYGADMGGVIEEMFMSVVRHDDADCGAILTDAVQFLHDFEVDDRVTAEMLQNML